MITEIKQKEFCRLTGLTRKALLIYENRDLLTPSRVDNTTGYRYYNRENVLLGIKIAFLRSMEFSLQEVVLILSEEYNSAPLMKNKSRELLNDISILNKGLQFVALNGTSPFPMSDEVKETRLDIVRVASIDGFGSNRDVAIHHKLLLQKMADLGVIASGSFGTYYYSDSNSKELHFKVFAPLSTYYETSAALTIEPFAPPKFLYSRFYGPYELLPDAYQNVKKHLKELSIPTTGEYLEFYRVYSSNETTNITDIGVPLWI